MTAKPLPSSRRPAWPLFHAVLAAAGLALGGCAVNNEVQQIVVNTVPPGADCTLTRGGKLLARISPTPGTVTTVKTPDPIIFHCTKPGFQTASYINQPGIQDSGMADRMATLFGQSSEDADLIYASPVTITLAAVQVVAPRPPAKIPYGALQPAPAPVPTPKVDSQPVAPIGPR